MYLENNGDVFPLVLSEAGTRPEQKMQDFVQMVPLPILPKVEATQPDQLLATPLHHQPRNTRIKVLPRRSHSMKYPIAPAPHR